jgi:hypothetical protein
MTREDRRTVEIARVLAGIRQACGAAPNTRADLIAAFNASADGLRRLREALGELLRNAQQR